MTARTLMMTTVAIAALAVPAMANAAAPNKHVTKHVVKPSAKTLLTRQGQSRQIYLYWPAPAGASVTQTQEEYEAQYNQDLIEHGLEPVTFPSRNAAPADAAQAPDVASTDASLAVATASTSPAASSQTDTTPVDDSADC